MVKNRSDQKKKIESDLNVLSIRKQDSSYLFSLKLENLGSDTLSIIETKHMLFTSQLKFVVEKNDSIIEIEPYKSIYFAEPPVYKDVLPKSRILFEVNSNKFAFIESGINVLNNRMQVHLKYGNESNYIVSKWFVVDDFLNKQDR